MTAIVMDNPPVCKYCGNIISSKRQSDPDWDGETCSNECEEALEDLMEDTWSDEDDEWMELDASRYYGNDEEDD